MNIESLSKTSLSLTSAAIFAYFDKVFPVKMLRSSPAFLALYLFFQAYGKESPLCTLTRNFNTEQVYVDDENVHDGDLPFLGSLGYYGTYPDWIHVCVVAVLSKKILISAAHCFKGSSDLDLKVTLGQVELNADYVVREKQIVNVDKVEMHPKYDNTSAYFDLCLIHTQEEIQFNDGIRPICLSDRPLNSVDGVKSRSVMLAGWGQHEGQEAHLKKMEMTIFGHDYCYQKYDVHGESDDGRLRETFLPNHVTSQTMCAGHVHKNEGSCKGDSGMLKKLIHSFFGFYRAF